MDRWYNSVQPLPTNVHTWLLPEETLEPEQKGNVSTSILLLT